MEEKRIAIVATSPLQIMLAQYICKEYKASYVKCFIMTYDGDNRYDKCKKLAEDYGFEVRPMLMKDCSSRWYILKNSVSSIFYNEGYDIVIQGIYANIDFYAFSIKLLKDGGDLIITDDGIATFQVQDNQFMKILFKNKLLKGLFLLMSFRKISHKTFYTIFDSIESSFYKMKKLSIQNNDHMETPHGVYFIGTFQDTYTPTFSPSLTNIQFNSLISNTVKYIRTHYPEEKILYTPHGRESKTKTLQICSRENLNLSPAGISVEIDYPLNGHYPLVIIGFTSTALFTLKAMYPLSKVIDVRPLNFKFNRTETLEKINKYEDSLEIERVYINV